MKNDIKTKLIEKERKDIEEKIDYEFKDLEWLNRAFTKDTLAKECKDKNIEIVDNQQLEFYGDSILNYCIITFLSENCNEDYNEEELTNFVTYWSNKITLGSIIKELDISQYLMMGNGDKKQKVNNQISKMEDLFEAIVGAVWFDSGKDISKTYDFVKKILKLTNSPEYFKKNAISKLKEFLDKKTKYDVSIVKSDNGNYRLEIKKIENNVLRLIHDEEFESEVDKHKISGAKLALKFLKKMINS